LLGYQPFEGQAARTTIAFHVTQAGFVPAHLGVQMKRTTDEAPVVFSLVQRTRVAPQNNWDRLKVAAWPGAATAQIPAGATTLLLWGQEAQLAPGNRLALVQGSYEQIVTLSDVQDVTLPGWAELPTAAPHTAPSELKQLAWHEPLTQPLRPWDADEPLTLYANLADAVHGQLKTALVNPVSEPDRQDVVIQFNRRNSIVVPQPRGTAVVQQLRALQVPEGPVLYRQSVEEQAADSRQVPALSVTVDGVDWSNVPSLRGSRSFDTHYVASADNDGRIWLQFGDGVQGREIPVNPRTSFPDVPIRIEYYVGDPLAGNCARDTLTEIVPPPPGTTAEDELAALGALRATNVVSGRGGKRPQSNDVLRQAIGASLRHGRLARAVSLADYATAAKQADPRVARAAAKALGGPFNTVLVLVDPHGQGQLPEDLRQRVRRHLDQLRMAGREHFVDGPSYVALEVELIVCINPGFLHHEVRDRTYAALRPGNQDQPGYFHPDRLSFGEDVELGDLLGFVQQLPGVRSVKARKFRRSAAVGGAAVVPRVVLGRTEVARLDGDENFPENGTLRVLVVGLDDVDERQEFAIDGPVAAGGTA
jgi:hypothetical protein